MKIKLPDARKNSIAYRVDVWLIDPEYRIASFSLEIEIGDRIQEVAGAVAEAVFDALQKKSELKRLHVATNSVLDPFDTPGEYKATDEDIPV